MGRKIKLCIAFLLVIVIVGCLLVYLSVDQVNAHIDRPFSQQIQMKLKSLADNHKRTIKDTDPSKLIKKNDSLLFMTKTIDQFTQTFFLQSHQYQTQIQQQVNLVDFQYQKLIVSGVIGYRLKELGWKYFRVDRLVRRVREIVQYLGWEKLEKILARKQNQLSKEARKMTIKMNVFDLRQYGKSQDKLLKMINKAVNAIQYQEKYLTGDLFWLQSSTGLFLSHKVRQETIRTVNFMLLPEDIDPKAEAKIGKMIKQSWDRTKRQSAKGEKMIKSRKNNGIRTKHRQRR